MAIDYLFTNGVIAVKEKALLKERLYKLCELSPDDAFRALVESGFGGGEEAASVNEFEKLTEAEERSLDAFIREYAPSRAELSYFLTPRDFHNAKALIKAEFLGIDAEKMLAPQGLIPVKTLAECIAEETYSELGILGGAMAEAAELFRASDDRATVSGAAVGGIFERALYRQMRADSARNKLLKQLFTAKADMTNILTAFRSPNAAFAEKLYVEGGSLKKETLARIFRGEGLGGTPYADFSNLCAEAKSANLPFSEAERIRDSYDLLFFADKKYALEKNLPFLYYVLRRRTECENVRIVFVCLLAGMKEREIKQRLRGERA